MHDTTESVTIEFSSLSYPQFEDKDDKIRDLCSLYHSRTGKKLIRSISSNTWGATSDLAIDGSVSKRLRRVMEASIGRWQRV